MKPTVQFQKYIDNAKEREKHLGKCTFLEIQDICLITRQTEAEGRSNRDTIREKTDGELEVGIRWREEAKEERAQK